ncbi:MAG: P44/Msp2 family outer membrane protein [Anaplasma sp.]
MKNISRRMVSLGSALVILAAMSPVSSALSIPPEKKIPTGERAWELASYHAESIGGFYLALSYDPAFGGVRKFKIREADHGTRVVIPYREDVSGRVDLMSNNFDWQAPNPEISFANAELVAFKGGIGYAAGRARVEVEIEHERFPIKKAKGGEAGRDEDADSVFFLGRELVCGVVSGQPANLSNTLTRITRSQAKRFAKTVESDARNGGPAKYASATATNVSHKICGTGSGIGGTGGVGGVGTVDRTNCRSGGANISNGGSPHVGIGYAASTTLGYDCKTSWSGCTALTTQQYDTLGMAFEAEGHVARSVSTYGNYKTKAGNAFDGTDATSKIKPEVAQTMAAAILKLSEEEQNIVTEAFVQSVEGGSVVKIPAVSSTSIMVNACYDVLSDIIGVVPYACAGIGGHLVSVVSGHIQPKFAYKVKAGLSYAVTPEISAFAGAYYHRVLGDGDYDDLPLQRLSDDMTVERSIQRGVASFILAYYGAEVGVRFAF